MTNTIKNKFFKWLMLALGQAILWLPQMASATGLSLNPFSGGATFGNLSDTGLGTADPVTVAGQLTNVFLRVLGTITILLMIYGGWIWLWARGNDEEIKKAKDIIRGSLIGLLVILASFGIMQFVFYYLTKITNAT